MAHYPKGTGTGIVPGASQTTARADTHCTACGAPLRPARLTESEALDAANIVRAYAQRIRDDVAAAQAAGADFNPHMLGMLEDAAKQRDQLCAKLESMA